MPDSKWAQSGPRASAQASTRVSITLSCWRDGIAITRFCVRYRAVARRSGWTKLTKLPLGPKLLWPWHSLGASQGHRAPGTGQWAPGNGHYIAGTVHRVIDTLYDMLYDMLLCCLFYIPTPAVFSFCCFLLHVREIGPYRTCASRRTCSQ